MRIDKKRRPAIRAELVSAILISKRIAFQLVYASEEYQVLFLGVDVEVAVFGADGTVAVYYGGAFERGEFDAIFDGCAVAVAVVRYLLGVFGG